MRDDDADLMVSRVFLTGVCPVCGKAPSYSITSGIFFEEDCHFVNGLSLVPRMPLSSELLSNWIQSMWLDIRFAYEEQTHCYRCKEPVKVVVTETKGYKEYALSCDCIQTDKYSNFGRAYVNWRKQAQSL